MQIDAFLAHSACFRIPSSNHTSRQLVDGFASFPSRPSKDFHRTGDKYMAALVEATRVAIYRMGVNYLFGTSLIGRSRKKMARIRPRIVSFGNVIGIHRRPNKITISACLYSFAVGVFMCFFAICRHLRFCFVRHLSN